MKEKDKAICQRFGIKNEVQIKLESPIKMNVGSHLVQIPLRFRCLICVYSIHKSADFQAHLRKHVGLRPFPCHLCSHSAMFKGNLKQHLKSHAGLKPFDCSFCSHKCLRKVDMDRHMRRHTKERPYKCPHCQYTATVSYSIKIHMNALHGEKLKTKSHLCNLCFKKFKRKSSLFAHIRRHTGEKPESCGFCKKRLSSRANQERHEVICKLNPKQSDKDWVDKQKIFKCHYENCEFSATEQSALRHHLTAHTRQGTYACFYCSYTSFKSHCVEYHTEKHHSKIK